MVEFVSGRKEISVQRYIQAKLKGNETNDCFSFCF